MSQPTTTAEPLNPKVEYWRNVAKYRTGAYIADRLLILFRLHPDQANRLARSIDDYDPDHYAEHDERFDGCN